MKYDLNRFKTEQNDCYPNVLSEIKNGKKSSHWMWYIFPQLELGMSSISKFYSIKGREEALEYLHHPILGTRLLESTRMLLELKTNDPYEVFFGDDVKLKSSMTLFHEVSTFAQNVFFEVLQKYFQGERCERTVEMLVGGMG
mgnify:CR=1 FL=1